MQPIVTPTEMASIDKNAPEPMDVLIRRAGWAVARESLVLLGGAYGKRVLVIAGQGNNGADGSVAAGFLRQKGVRCDVLSAVDVASVSRLRHRYDLVIDAAYGTGFKGEYVGLDPALVGGVSVLAVDIPSGVDGLTGAVCGNVLSADVTVCFAALKPGLVFPPGRNACGRVNVVDIGLGVPASTFAVERSDLERWPVAQADDHKWDHATLVVGGSQNMVGAVELAAEAASRAGSSYVTVAAPRASGAEAPLNSGCGPSSIVFESVQANWADWVLSRAERMASVVVGPGLIADEIAGGQVRQVVENLSGSLVLDAGALDAVIGFKQLLRNRSVPAILTPHDGEFRRLTGELPGADRISAARAVAADLSAVIVLKGPTTVVAAPSGMVAVSCSADQRLATAGSGDVLAGVIGGGLALGLSPFWAAALGVELHSQAALLGPAYGLCAQDLPGLVTRVRNGEG